MRIEIAEQLAVCAMHASEKHLVDDGKQRKGMYAKVARFGSSIISLGLIPTVMRFEEDRENKNVNPGKKDGDFRVNDAIFATLQEFVRSDNKPGLWIPDEQLKTLVESSSSLKQLYCGLQNAADYELVKEYSALVCASLKLALNTYPNSEKSKTAKGNDEHDG